MGNEAMNAIEGLTTSPERELICRANGKNAPGIECDRGYVCRLKDRIRLTVQVKQAEDRCEIKSSGDCIRTDM
jgi:hypothetical protein